MRFLRCHFPTAPYPIRNNVKRTEHTTLYWAFADRLNDKNERLRHPKSLGEHSLCVFGVVQDEVQDHNVVRVILHRERVTVVTDVW